MKTMAAGSNTTTYISNNIIMYYLILDLHDSQKQIFDSRSWSLQNDHFSQFFKLWKNNVIN